MDMEDALAIPERAELDTDEDYPMIIGFQGSEVSVPSGDTRVNAHRSTRELGAHPWHCCECLGKDLCLHIGNTIWPNVRQGLRYLRTQAAGAFMGVSGGLRCNQVSVGKERKQIHMMLQEQQIQSFTQ